MQTNMISMPQSDPRARELERNTARALGAYYVWEFVRRPTDPAWDDLTLSQQMAARSAFQIGAASLKAERLMKRSPRCTSASR